MQLYEVIRWGNDGDDPFMGGPNGPDTCFLVRAESVEQAAQLVDARLAQMPHQLVQPWAGASYLLGEDLAEANEPLILRGPYMQSAYRYGWRHWYREESDGSWVERDQRE